MTMAMILLQKMFLMNCLVIISFSYSGHSWSIHSYSHTRIHNKYNYKYSSTATTPSTARTSISTSLSSLSLSPSSMETALCIIPPDDAWDDIQRARHLCHDTTFYKWPPAIRLFHPFLPKSASYSTSHTSSTITNAALEIASIIETYDISKFNITLDHLLILPFLEEIEDRLEEEKHYLPNQSSSNNNNGYDDSNTKSSNNSDEYVEEMVYDKKRKRKIIKRTRITSTGTTTNTNTNTNLRYMSQQEKDIQELIANEEIKGKQKKLKRLEREKQRHIEMYGDDNNDGDDTDSVKEDMNRSSSESNDTSSSTTTNSNDNNSNNNPNNFNGPCILCLEPNEESQLQLYTLREILRKKIFDDYDPFSPSSILPRQRRWTNTYDTSNVNHDGSNNKRRNLMNDGLNLLPKSILKKHGLLPSQSKKQKSTSSSSTISNKNKRKKKKQEGSTFRPLIVLGQFSTVTKAVSLARQLQRSWEPLTFEVCDLQIVSTMTTGNGGGSDKSGGVASSTKSSSTSRRSSKLSSSSIQVDDNNHPILPENREYEIRKQYGTTSSSSIGSGGVNGSSSSNGEEEENNFISFATIGEYGCDAMIMLMGEEGILTAATSTTSSSATTTSNDNIESSSSSLSSESLDNNGNEDEIIDLLMTKAGTPGGGANPSTSSSSTSLAYVSNAGQSLVIESNDTNNEDDIITSAFIEEWLNDDDDDEYDEGATVIIGRTQFFMGEMKQYTGMPASSTIDGKDKKLGDHVSGAARRRGAVHRQGDRWNDGDFGSKEKDSLA